MTLVRDAVTSQCNVLVMIIWLDAVLPQNEIFR